MRSTKDDSTTRARIRDATILLIGERGFAATSARAVATEAGVSAGLVIHHFGSMRELKRACDEFIITELTQLKKGIGESDISATLNDWYSDLDAYQPWLNYLTRLFTDDSDAGIEIFDRLVTMTTDLVDEGVSHDQMRPSTDAHARAVLLVTHSLGTLILQSHIARALGSDRFSLETLSRMGNAALEIYTEGLYTDDSTLTAARDASNAAHNSLNAQRHVHDPDSDPPSQPAATASN
ncbi:TetR family transcriptional regulator [Salinibacterium sp. M195]|uniref:TetR family transcriptional regulator n=1 Tax=Salinibacterium sp. M195 TaxID=2583374 RepID=UPI001C635786|nr:TetR family transcriptional regulator [Salinibacterium sp. M195]QYH35403.1 TetR/AcrR family transcriptional regulator [Salinibacterium sp. M195]